MEDTLVLIKPDAVERHLVGQIISRFEDNGFQIFGIEARMFEDCFLKRLYQEHEGKPFYAGNMEFMSSGTIVALWLRARNAVDAARLMIGGTDPSLALPGTIRGDFGGQLPRNCVHASDSPESAIRELSIFFDDFGL